MHEILTTRDSATYTNNHVPPFHMA